MRSQAPDPSRRVVVTGVGSVASCGVGREALRAALRGGRSFVRPLTRFDASSYPSRIAAEVDGFDPASFMDPDDAERIDRSAQFAVAAAVEAVRDAGLCLPGADPRRAGVSIGIAAGCMTTCEDHLLRQDRGEPDLATGGFYTRIAAASASAVVARHLGLRGRTHTLSTGCTTGTDSVGYAFQQIRAGRADVMIAGGTDAPVAPLAYGCFAIIRAMSTRNEDPESASRPFDRDRDGFVLGEGAGVVVLESLDHALRRGVPVYMEVAGYGTTLNAHHMTAPPPDGREMARAIAMALDDARVDPAGIEYVSAHGSSTPLNDAAETTALKRAFGDHARRLWVSSIKSVIGHTFGAAGGHQAAAAALAFRDGLVPPTVNLRDPDPACDLDCVPGAPRPRRLGAMLQNACGFCGKNAALVYRRFDAA
jgi:beta-ketoacyl-acyl-carrier-protein synthase II